MGFTVARHGGTTDMEFEAYVRLLEKHGVDVADLQRVAEPGTDHRWLHVWDSRAGAERFKEELQASTRDDEWYVHELNRDDRVSTGPLGPVGIYIGRQHDGCAFSLHPQSRSMIQRKFPNSCRVDSVFVGSQTKEDFESTQGGEPDLLHQVALLLTGLTEGQLQIFGGYRLYDPVERKTLRQPAHVD